MYNNVLSDIFPEATVLICFLHKSMSMRFSGVTIENLYPAGWPHASQIIASIWINYISFHKLQYVRFTCLL